MLDNSAPEKARFSDYLLSGIRSGNWIYLEYRAERDFPYLAQAR